VGGGTGVAAHPVAQLTEQVIPTCPLSQPPHRSHPPRTHTFHTIYDGKGLSEPQTPNYAKGKLTKVTSSVSATEYQLFDNLGRMTQMTQITDGYTYTSKYTFNFSMHWSRKNTPRAHGRRKISRR